MKRPAAKGKTRSSGSSRSYLQTRVRASRLYEAASILAIFELTRRLHQAYEQAYDKRAADWLLPQNTMALAKVSGGTGNSPSFSQDQIKTAVNACSHAYFRITIQSIDPSRPRYNGTVNGTDLDTSAGNSNVTVVNDVKSFSGKKLRDIYVQHGGPSGSPLLGLTVGGFGDSFSAYRDFTANDLKPGQTTLAGVSAWEDTQIWELGNSLAGIKSHNNLPSRIEAGQSFEDCVRAVLNTGKGYWSK
jgi:hypothetical protein